MVMSPKKIIINWSDDAKYDLSVIFHALSQRNSSATSRKILKEIILSTTSIIFPEQFQVDENRKDCRRIIIRNYKVLYNIQENMINIVTVIDSRRNPY